MRMGKVLNKKKEAPKSPNIDIVQNKIDSD